MVQYALLFLNDLNQCRHGSFEIYGDENTLKKITSLPLKVDLSGIDHDVTKNITLKLPDGVVKASPSVICAVTGSITTLS